MQRIKMRKVFSAALAALLIISLCACFFVGAEETLAIEQPEKEPDAFAGIEFSYDPETKTLTVFGSGDMPSCVNGAPWYPVAINAEKLVVSEGITAIGSYAFSSMSALAEIELPSGIRSIGMMAFYNTYFYNLAENRTGGALYISVSDEEKYLIDAEPAVGLTYTVEQGTVLIADNAFEGCASINTVTVPEGVKYIGDCAFRGCVQLRRIDLPKTVIEIGERATVACEKLTSVRYAGSPKAFAAVSILEGNDALRNATLKCSESDESDETTAAPQSPSYTSPFSGCGSFSYGAFVAAVAVAVVAAFVIIKKK